MIIGRDLLVELGLVINFKNQTIDWDGVVIQFPRQVTKDRELRVTSSDVTSTNYKAVHTEVLEPTSTNKITSRVTRILDAVYEPADLDIIVSSYEHLDKKVDTNYYSY